MANMQFEDKRSSEPKSSVTIDELHEMLEKLSVKIDLLTKSMKDIEQKVDLLNGPTSKSIQKSEVEIEEITDIEENYLTPNDLIFENEALKNTGMKLIMFRIATASDISNVTKKERAVESLYLNDLASRNRIRKLRIGRKIYFYIGKSTEIEPFKNNLIKTEWREVLICIIRELTTFETNKKIRIKNIIKNYIENAQLEDDNDNIIDKRAIEEKVRNTLKEISTGTNFILNDFENDKVEFIPSAWLKLT